MTNSKTSSSSGATLSISAPAKLNLFLHITGRRSNGYHELQTVFQLLDYGDTIELTPDANNTVRLIKPTLGVADEDNIVIRAAKQLQAHLTQPRGVAINIDKRLPMGGGLGGGSSDAASTLLGLNQLWDLGLNIDELAAIGLKLGADVPVFVRGHSCFAEGIGERIHPLELPPAWFLIVKPPINVSTAVIFSHRQLTRDSVPIRIAAVFAPQPSSDSGASVGNERRRLSPKLNNDCEAVVRAEYPAVDKAFNWLNRYGSAQLTGTGSCIFASFTSEREARNAHKAMPAPLTGFVAKGLNKSLAYKHLALHEKN